VYFAIAASRHAPVLLQGIVGRDTAEDHAQLLQPFAASMDGVAVSATPTLLWHAVHDFQRWVTASESSEPGCDPEWIPRLSQAASSAEVLFLGSMHPALQLEVRAQTGARLVGSDSMTVFLRSHHDSVLGVVRRSDVLFLNRAELAALTGDDDWRNAANQVLRQGASAVVVKAGPLGAALVTRDGVIERDAAPVDRVIDPTGAGDALAGGFLGVCAATERFDPEIAERGLDDGLRCAAAAISTFGPQGLLRFAGAGGPGNV